MDRALELTRQAERTHFWFRGCRRFVAPVLHDLAGARRDLRLIDCGCGTGFNLNLLRPYGSVYGFDLSAGGVAHARRSGANVVRGDVTRIPFVSNQFDIATSFDVLQSVEGDQAAVREMARVLRPGGAVVLTVAALEVLRGDHSIAWKEVRRYTPALARQLVCEAGRHPVRASFTFASVFPHSAGVRVAQRALRPFRGVRQEADIRVPVAPVNALLTGLVSAEAALARHVPMPIGSSLLVVARKD